MLITRKPSFQVPDPSLFEKAFLYCLSEMVEYSKALVTVPYETRLSENESLCGSIFMSQKLQKTINKIRGTLDEVKGNHR